MQFLFFFSVKCRFFFCFVFISFNRMRCCDLPKGDYQSESPKVQPHLLAQSDIYLGNKRVDPIYHVSDDHGGQELGDLQFS
jgi:hypothetical protein